MSAQSAAAPTAKHSAPNTVGTQLVPLREIRPDPANRKDHDKAKLQDLADQIKAEGLLQPIVVRPLRPDEKPAHLVQYEIIAGERRFLAHVLLKREKIEAKIVEGVTALQAVTKQTMENAAREDLNPIEKARQMKRLADLKMPQAEIGKLFGGLSQPVVSNTMRLLELPDWVQDSIARGELEVAAGVELVRFSPWPKACEFIARRYLKTAWGAKELRNRALPFDDELVTARLAVEIPLKRDYYYGEPPPSYTLPAALQANPAFFKGYHAYFYLLPTDPKAPNLWAPEKEKQDKARAEEEAKKKQAAAAAVKSGGKKGKPTKEQIERKKKLDKNKQSRAEIDGTLAHAILELKGAKGVHSSALAVICDNVLGGHEVVSLEEAAAAIGLKLPKSLQDAGYGESNEALRTLGLENMVKLAAAAIMLGESNQARRFASEVPASSSFVAGKKAKASSVQVKTRRKGTDFLAKAGEAKASSTSSHEAAAAAAAAKHLSCSASQVQLLRMDVVDQDEDEDATDTATFTATKGGKS